MDRSYTVVRTRLATAYAGAGHRPRLLSWPRLQERRERAGGDRRQRGQGKPDRLGGL